MPQSTSAASAPRIRVRRMQHDELAAVCEVADSAFGAEAGIGPLIGTLRESWAWEDELSFVAEVSGAVVGQVLYTHAFVDAPQSLLDVLVLSPVSLRPEHQNRGIGSRLITESLDALAERREPMVFLEGHPGYYPRFGFRPAGELGFVAPSVRIPPDAFMVYPLDGYESWMTGALVYPDAFWRADAVGLRGG